MFKVNFQDIKNNAFISKYLPQICKKIYGYCQKIKGIINYSIQQFSPGLMLSNFDDIPENPYILSPRHRNLQVQINRPELMKCTEIISRQQHKKPAWSDVQQVTKALMKLDIFNTRLVRQNINPKIIVERLIPFLTYEVFYATTPIIHYGEEATKLYVVCQGSTKEFIGKSNYEIQKETREQEKKQTVFHPILPLHSSVVSEEADSSPESCKKSPARRALKKDLRKSKNSPSTTMENQKAFVDSVLRKSSKFATALVHLKTVIALNGNKSNSKPTTNEKTFRRGALKGINAGDYEPEPTDYNFDGFREKRDLYYSGTVLKVKPSRTYNEGQYFGFKLTENSTETRPTAMAAWTDCYCLTVEGETLLRIIEEEKAISAYKVELFNEIFPDHTKQAIINFSYFWKERNYTHNEPIFEQGDPSDCIYTLVSGEITFSKTVPLPPKEPGQREEPSSAKTKSSNHPKTTIIKVAKVCDGSFFGEEDFFLDQARTLTATVTSIRAKVLQLDKKFYLQMYANHQDMFEKIMNLSETKYNYNIERLENLNNITTNATKEDKAQEYMNLKDNMQISLQRPADPLPKIEGSSPKLKVYRHGKKQLSAHTNYKNIMNEINEDHPLLMNFITENKPMIKHSHSKDRSTTTIEECESATIHSARLPSKLSNTEPNEPRSWLPSFRRGDKKGTAVPKSGSLSRETRPSHTERDSYDPLIVFNTSSQRTQTDTSISQQSPLLSKFNPIRTTISQSISERSPLLSTKYKNINAEIRKCMKKLSENSIKMSPRPSSKGKLEPIFINTGKTPAASAGNISERKKRDSLNLIDSLKKIPLYTAGNNDYVATTATSLTQSFRPFQDKPFAIETLEDDDDDTDSELANKVEIVDDVSDDLFNFVTRKNRPKLRKLEIKKASS